MKSVLIVEDDHDTRVSIRGILEAAGYFVVSAANGADALTLLEKITPPDVILLDILMPIMDGNQFMKVLQLDSRFLSCRILQMSASATPQLPGTHGLLPKPLQLKDLLKAVAATE